MINTRLIKRRIKSAQNISQITRAMEMVAASKMKKAQDQAISGKPYATNIYDVTREFVKRVNKEIHPLLAPANPEGKLMVVLISTNKGLCGGLNTNLFRTVFGLFKNNPDIDFITVGKKGQSFIVRSGKNLIADFSLKTPFSQNVAPITSLIIDGFIKGAYKEVYLIFNTFFSALKQFPTKRVILPIASLNISTENEKEGMDFSEFLIEPDINSVLDSLLSHYLENQVRAAILEAEACEHSARMIAMKNATDAAGDFISDLTLIYNKARQEKITNEIADMVTARMAVE